MPATRKRRMTGFKQTLSPTGLQVYNTVLQLNRERKQYEINYQSWWDTQRIAHGHTDGEIMVFSTIARLLGRPATEGGTR
jgi:hypothetical protein